MDETQHAANCRWATPTLFVAAPFWLAAEEFPWSCVRDAAPRLLATTDVCATCARWDEATLLSPQAAPWGRATVDPPPT
jgi:hypothetical protein